MALLSSIGANAALNGLDGTGSTNVMGFGALCTGSPGTTTTAANEYSGVTRQSVAWSGASGSAKANSGTVTWTTSGALAVTHVAMCSSATVAANYAVGLVLGSSVTAVTITAAPGALSLAGS